MLRISVFACVSAKTKCAVCAVAFSAWHTTRLQMSLNLIHPLSMVGKVMVYLIRLLFANISSFCKSWNGERTC